MLLARWSGNHERALRRGGVRSDLELKLRNVDSFLCRILSWKELTVELPSQEEPHKKKDNPNHLCTVSGPGMGHWVPDSCQSLQ